MNIKVDIIRVMVKIVLDSFIRSIGIIVYIRSLNFKVIVIYGVGNYRM